MNEVTVTVLPHPVTMFFIGAMLLGIVLLLIEFSKTRREVRETKKEFNTMNKHIIDVKSYTEKSIQEVSRKVDSRIDKALGNLKKD
jgi:hypothetical protein